MSTKIKLSIVALVFAVVGWFGYKYLPNPVAPSPASQFKITTSFYPLYFFTTELAGDKAAVFNLTPAGFEPHDYEPTAQDVARLEDSQLVILNGGAFEPWANGLADLLQNKSVVVGQNLFSQQLSEDGRTVADPHVWLSPVLAKEQSRVIAQALIKADPANAAHYGARLNELMVKFDDLNDRFTKGLAVCQSKNIITAHSAFGYLAKQYGLNQVAISGLSPDAEPSVKELAEVAEFARKNNVNYIFFESLVSPRLADTIAKEIGAQTLVLNPLEGLTEDETRAGKNYFTEMETNLTNLRVALRCS